MPPKKGIATDHGTKGNEENQYEIKFAQIGFRKIPTPDGDMPKFPTKLDHLSVQQLSNQQALYGAWREYSEDLVRALTVSVMLAQQEYDTAHARAVIVATGKNVTEKKLNADIDESVMEAYNKLLHLQIELDMYTKKTESFTNCLAILSREITLRQNK